MAEGAQRSSVIDYIHTVVVGKTPTQESSLTSVLSSFEAFLRRTLTDTTRSQRSIWSPPMVDRSVFEIVTKPFPDLNGDTPPVAILKTIEKETGTRLSEEVVVFQSQNTGLEKDQQPIDVFVLHADETSRQTPDSEKPPRVDRLVKDGKLYSSVTAMRRSGLEVGYNQLQSLFSELPGEPAQSKNGHPVILYPEEEAYNVIAQWTEEKRRKQTLKESRRQKLDPALWAPTKLYADVYDLSLGTVAHILQEVGKTRFRFSNYYRRDQANEAFRDYFSKRRTSEGIYFRDGEPRVPLDYLHKRTGISHPKLKNEIGSKGIVDAETGLTLYSLTDAVARLDQLEGIPHVANDGIYTEKSGRRWASASVIKDLLGISFDKLNQYLEGVETLPVRGIRNYPRRLNISAAYDIDEIERRAASYLSRPMVTQSEHGKEILLITAEQLAADYDLPVSSVRIFLRPIHIATRGKTQTAYVEEQARIQLDEVMQLPKINTRTNRYINEQDDIYVVKTEAGKELRMTVPAVNRAIEIGTVEELNGRKGLAVFDLYRLSDIEESRDTPLVPKPKQPRQPQPIRDRRSELEQEARVLISNGVDLSVSGSQLAKQGYSGFVERVRRYYDGRLRGLQENLGIAKPVEKKDKKDGIPTKKNTQWAKLSEDERNDLLEKRARALIAKGIRLGSTILVKIDPALLRAAGRYYSRGSGGLNGLREVLGVADTVKKQRNWKAEKDPRAVLSAEIDELIKEKKGKDVTSEDLHARGLYLPIEKYWEGGYYQMRLDKGLPLLRVPKGFWTDERVRKRVAAIIKRHGGLSTPLLEELGEIALLGQINKRGGIGNTLKEVGLQPNRREWDDATIEQEALSIYEGKNLSWRDLKRVSGLSMAVLRKYEGSLIRLNERLRELAK